MAGKVCLRTIYDDNGQTVIMTVEQAAALCSALEQVIGEIKFTGCSDRVAA
jgi:hypothetical protein